MRFSGLTTQNTDRELRYIGRWERKKLSEQVGSMAQGVPFRSQIAVSVSQNARQFLSTMGFRYVLRSTRLFSLCVGFSDAFAHRHSYRYMRLGTRWQLSNGITIEATRMKAVRVPSFFLLF